jgi:hypothetical protein
MNYRTATLPIKSRDVKLLNFAQDIPLNKRLYVLEDIDCADLKDIVKDRDAKKSKEEGDEEDEEEKEKNGGEETSGGLDLLTLLKVPSAENFKNRNKVESNTFSSVFFSLRFSVAFCHSS